MHFWGLLLVICSCIIIPSVANDDSDEFQKCLNGFCVRKTLCPNGIYDEKMPQDLGIVVPRFGVGNVCRDEEVCCKEKSVGCGVSNPNGIGNQSLVNHAYAKYGEYPWVVLILQQQTAVGQGTLIHPWFVLTTAHNYKSTDHLVAIFGEWDYNKQNNAFPKQIIDIENILVHPKYRRIGYQNDIALAQLKQIVHYDKHIRPLCLPSPNDLFDHQQCTCAGWGKKLNMEFSNVLKRVDLPVIPTQRCKELFAKTRLGPFFQLHNSVLCAGALNDQDMCDGDGGSGLFCPTKSGSYVLAGIVSWGLSCYQQDVPGAYVNVAQFVQWINETIEGRV